MFVPMNDALELLPAGILDGMNVGMFNSTDMSIDVVGADGVLNLGGSRAATVIITKVLCSNGTIHVIDAVLDTGDATAP